MFSPLTFLFFQAPDFFYCNICVCCIAILSLPLSDSVSSGTILVAVHWTFSIICLSLWKSGFHTYAVAISNSGLKWEFLCIPLSMTLCNKKTSLRLHHFVGIGGYNSSMLAKIHCWIKHYTQIFLICDFRYIPFNSILLYSILELATLVAITSQFPTLNLSNHLFDHSTGCWPLFRSSCRILPSSSVLNALKSSAKIFTYPSTT